MYFDQKKKNRELQERQKAERAVQQRADKQKNIGGRIYNALCKAAAENPNRIVVVKIEQNAGAYSVSVGHNLPDVFTHLQPCFQVDIMGMKRDSIYVYQPYNHEWEWGTTEEDILRAIEFLVAKTKVFGVNGQYGPY